jgi:hypothetical protein
MIAPTNLDIRARLPLAPSSGAPRRRGAFIICACRRLGHPVARSVSRTNQSRRKSTSRDSRHSGADRPTHLLHSHGRDLTDAASNQQIHCYSYRRMVTRSDRRFGVLAPKSTISERTSRTEAVGSSRWAARTRPRSRQRLKCDRRARRIGVVKPAIPQRAPRGHNLDPRCVRCWVAQAVAEEVQGLKLLGRRVSSQRRATRAS